MSISHPNELFQKRSRLRTESVLPIAVVGEDVAVDDGAGPALAAGEPVEDPLAQPDYPPY